MSRRGSYSPLQPNASRTRCAAHQRSCFLAGICAFLAASGATSTAAQTVVPVHEEPRHRLVHQSDALQILDIGFPAGDTTLFHTHDRPIAYVEIDATVVNQQRLGGPWGEVSETAAPPRRPPGRVSWNESYAESPVTHRVTAIGPGAFRLIGVVNRGAGNLQPRMGAFGPFGEPDASSRYFSRLSLELGPAQSMEWVNGGEPVAVVLASDAAIDVSAVAPSRGAADASVGTTSRMTGPGTFFVFEPDRAYRISNPTGVGAILAFVEVR